MLRYWAKRPGQAERLFFPVVRPLRRSPRTNEYLEADDPAQPLLADPDYESENDFLDRAREHYRARAEALTVTPHPGTGDEVDRAQDVVDLRAVQHRQ